MTLEVVVAAEGLDALVALEGALRLGRRLGVVPVDHVSVVALGHAGHHGHLGAGLVHVGHDGAAHGGQLAVRGVVRGAVAAHAVVGQAGAGAAGGGRRLGRVLGRIRRELGRRRGGVVAGVAAGPRVGVGVRVGGEARGGRGLRGAVGGQDARVLGRRRHVRRLVRVVLGHLVKGRRGDALGARGGRLRGARRKVHVGLAVHGLAAVGRLGERLLGLGVVRLLLLRGRVGAVGPRAGHVAVGVGGRVGGGICVSVHVARVLLGGLGSGCVDREGRRDAVGRSFIVERDGLARWFQELDTTVQAWKRVCGSVDGDGVTWLGQVQRAHDKV